MTEDRMGFDQIRGVPPANIGEWMKKLEGEFQIKFQRWAEQFYKCHMGKTVEIGSPGGSQSIGIYRGLTDGMDHVLLPVHMNENHTSMNEKNGKRKINPVWVYRPEFIRDSSLLNIGPIREDYIKLRDALTKGDESQIIIP